MAVVTKIIGAESIDLVLTKSLFDQCKWDWLEPSDLMREAFKNSHCLFGAFQDGKLIAFARIISDGIIYGFLADMMVAPDHRNQGVGKLLMNFISEQCRRDGIRILKLISSEEGYPFYEKSGFTKCPEDAPGMIKFLNLKVALPD